MDISTDGGLKSMERRAEYQVITEVKSAPVGVNWSMIRAAKKSIHQQKYLQRPMSKVSVPGISGKQVVGAY